MIRCGTNRGYQDHRRQRQVPCLSCCAAHAAAMAEWRATRPRPIDGPDEPIRYAMAFAGREPAEALTTRDRWRLVAELHRTGLTDVEVAAHTRMTTHTAARIRNAMSLPVRQRMARHSRRGAA